VDRGRKGSNRNVHEQADGVLGVLLEGTFIAELDRIDQCLLWNLTTATVDSKDRRRFHYSITNGRNHFDYRSSRASNPYESRDINRLNLAWDAVVKKGLGAGRLNGRGRAHRRRLDGWIQFLDDPSTLFTGEDQDLGDLQPIHALNQPDKHNDADDEQ